MKKLISFLLLVSLALSVVAIGASAVYAPIDTKEMKAALDEKATAGEGGGMALGWGFDDIGTKSVEYVKNAYDEASALARAGKYTFTRESADETAARAVDGLSSVAVLEKKDGSESITLYKFEDIEKAAAYAETLAAKYAPEEEGKEPEVYVRALGVTVAEGKKELVYKVGVTVVDNAVLHGDFISSAKEEMQSGYYESLKEGSTSGMQFKTPDSAIRYRNGELIISKAEKDYYVTDGSYAGYKSVDAYMDVYATEFDYAGLHDAHGGDSFVLSARLRAPYSYLGSSVSGTMNIFTPRCAFNVKVNGVQKKLTIDQTVLQYNASTREVFAIDGGVKVNTGTYLSDYEYTTVAVHIHPTTNTYDFYVDGLCVLEEAQFLSNANLQNLHSDPYAEPTGDGADYTLTRVRLFYMNYKNLTGDILCIDDFAWYFSEEYLERAEDQTSVVAKSLTVGARLYINFYLNLHRAVLYDYSVNVAISVGDRTVNTIAMAGVPVTDGELQGLVRYSAEIDVSELDDEITLKLVSDKGNLIYLYGDTGAKLRGYTEYKTTVKDYLATVIDGEQFSENERALAKATLNYGAAAECYFAGIKFGSGDLKDLPNEGYEYGEELDSVTYDDFVDAVESEIYKNYTSTGSVPLLKIVKNTLSFDNGIYITVTYSYTGMKNLKVNGEKPTGEYKINVGCLDAMNSVYTVVFHDGTNCMRMKISPYHLAANMMSSELAPDYTVNFIKVMYLYNKAFEACFLENAE